MELADLQVQRENDPKTMNLKCESKKETKELMAAKEEIRSLKSKVELLEKQKKSLKESTSRRKEYTRKWWSDEKVLQILAMIQ